MKKYEVIKPVMLMVGEGSIVELSDEQAALVKSCIEEYIEPEQEEPAQEPPKLELEPEQEEPTQEQEEPEQEAEPEQETKPKAKKSTAAK